MTCQRCISRGKTWEGSDPKCAFLDDGSYTLENWNCATMSALRDATEEGDGHFPWLRWDDQSIGIIPCAAEMDGFIVMLWYKRRGATGNAFVLREREEPIPLTLSIAEAALEKLK